MKTVRVFKSVDSDGNDIVLEFRRPSQQTHKKAELVYRQKFSEALRGGIVLQAEVAKLLKERGLWTEEDEATEHEMRVELKALEESLKDDGVSNDDGLKIVEQIKALRLKIREHTAIFTSVADATCESVANEERNMFYASECIYNKQSGAKVYKNLEDFQSRLDEQFTVDSYREATIAALELVVGQELPSDLTTQYAENIWVAERGLDEDKEEESEEDAAPAQKKKRRRKTKAKAAAGE